MATRTRKQLVADYLIYLVVRVIICMVQMLSIESIQGLSRTLAWLASDVLKFREKVTDANLRAVYPDWSEKRLRRVKRRMWEHLIQLICEIAIAPRKIHETNWRKYVRVRDRDKIVKYLLDPRPLVFVSGHFGNFEMAGYIAGLLGFPTFAIARPLDNAYIDRFLKRFRSAKGQYMLPKDGSAPIVQNILEKGGTLSLLADQHAGPKGCWVDFMGRPASCHKAVAVFTMTNDAPLMVCYVRRLGRPMRFEVGLAGWIDPATMPANLKGIKPITAWYNKRLEDVIRAQPDQYWWLHRRWREPPARRKKTATAAA